LFELNHNQNYKHPCNTALLSLAANIVYYEAENN